MSHRQRTGIIRVQKIPKSTRSYYDCHLKHITLLCVGASRYNVQHWWRFRLRFYRNLSPILYRRKWCGVGRANLLGVTIWRHVDALCSCNFNTDILFANSTFEIPRDFVYPHPFGSDSWNTVLAVASRLLCHNIFILPSRTNIFYTPGHQWELSAGIFGIFYSFCLAYCAVAYSFRFVGSVALDYFFLYHQCKHLSIYGVELSGQLQYDFCAETLNDSITWWI